MEEADENTSFIKSIKSGV
jgi:MFS family permease